MARAAGVPEIRTFFDGYLNAYRQTIPIDDNMIAWPNTDFKPNNKKIYIKPDLVPADEEMASLGEDGFNSLLGFYQVSIFAPQGEGMAPAEAVVRAVLELFPTGARFAMGCFDILVARSYQSPAQQVDGRLMIPVSIYYNAYTQRKGG
jgi:hypothetical protein